MTTAPPTTLRLEDGRTIGYATYGDPDGRPAVHCHGGLVCRLDIASADDAARDLGIRIIVPDRPGVGRSDRHPGATMLDWTADVNELVDALGIDRFTATGWSAGGQYALALAHTFGARIESTIVLAGCPPLDDPQNFDALSALDKRLLGLAHNHVSRARLTFAAMRSMARHLPERFVRASARDLGPHDARVAALPTTGYAAMVAEGLRQTRGAVDDYLVFGAPWGFDPAEISSPVRVWWGDQDQLVARPLIDALVRLLPHCNLRVVPDAGHFVAFDRWPEVLAPIAA